MTPQEVPLQTAVSPGDSSGLGKLKVRPISGPAGALITCNAGAGEDQHAQPPVLHTLQLVESTSLAGSRFKRLVVAIRYAADFDPQHKQLKHHVGLNTAALPQLRVPPAALGAAPAQRCSLPPVGHAMKGCWQVASLHWASSHSHQAGRRWCAQRDPVCGLAEPWAACQRCPAGSSG